MNKRIWLAAICMLFIVFTACANNEVSSNTKQVSTKIKSLNQEVVSIKELTDFEWDKAYVFTEYTSKSEIEEIVGFNSEEIVDMMGNEGNTNLLFVKDKKVVGAVDGSPQSLGYSIDFGTIDKFLCFEYTGKCNFTVQHEDGDLVLTYKK